MSKFMFVLEQNLSTWKEKFESWFEKFHFEDASHDLTHIKRVAKLSFLIGGKYKEADLLVLLASAYFHDVVAIEKNDPKRKIASTLAAEKASEVLHSLGFPLEHLPKIEHAISAHSFSANITPKTLEAKILQDADRLDALGAFGIMRAFYCSGRMNNLPYHPDDPLAKKRELNDKLYCLDHFVLKLLQLKNMMQTEVGYLLAEKREQILHEFREQLGLEIESKNFSSAVGIVRAFYEAGKTGALLYSEEDPFAENRKILPDRYGLDKLLGRSGFRKFLGALQKELNPLTL